MNERSWRTSLWKTQMLAAAAEANKIERAMP